MIDHSAEQLKKDIQAIDELIEEALKHDFLPDKLYVLLTTKIGTFDETFVRAKCSTADEAFFKWARLRLDKICDMLMKERFHAKHAKGVQEDDLMHPTGDYYNEDNSLYLSKHVKNNLKNLLAEKFLDKTIR